MHIVVPIAAIALVVGAIWFIERRIRRARAAETELQGFHGWLAILAANQFIGLAVSMGVCVILAPDLAKLWQAPAWRAAAVVEGGVAVCMALLMLYTTVVMVKRRRLFPMLYRIQLIILLVAPILMILGTSALTGASLAQLGIDGIIGEELFGAVLSVLWIAYTMKSVRVRNTFVR